MGALVRAARRANSWFAAHPYRTDAAVALVLGILTVVGYYAVEPEGSQRADDIGGLLLIVGTAVGYALRRRRAFLGFAIVIVGTIVFWVADYAAGFEVFSLLAIYSVVVHGGRNRRRVWIVAGTGIVALAGITLIGLLAESEGDVTPAVAVAIAIVGVTAAVVGEVVYGRQRRIRLLEARAVRAEAERELLAREAVLAERSRIARDLHDIVAHSMSVMVVQAGAAERMVTTRPERAAEALRQVQQTGRDALAEMRRMLGVLRDDATTDKLSPQPTASTITELVAQCDAAGVSTGLRIVGDRPDQVNPAADVAAYRIVQEALTNVLKHAGPGASASVMVSYSPSAIRLEVIDDGVGALVADTSASTGHGLIGMRERIELFDGTLHVGPRPGGGFRVAATIPLDEPATPRREPDRAGVTA